MSCLFLKSWAIILALYVFISLWTFFFALYTHLTSIGRWFLRRVVNSQVLFFYIDWIPSSMNYIHLLSILASSKFIDSLSVKWLHKKIKISNFFSVIKELLDAHHSMQPLLELYWVDGDATFGGKEGEVANL